MRLPALAGLPGRQAQSGRTSGYAPATGERALGNPLPQNTGLWQPDPALPGPGPAGYPAVAGTPAGFSPWFGSDPRAPEVPPVVFLPGQDPAGMDAGVQNNPGPWRNGINGFNDQLRLVDRHAYWDAGTQKTGLEGFPPAGSPNAYNDPLTRGPRPDLRTVNRTVSHQIGSDATRNQDDLSRGYTRNAQGMFIGEQGAGYAPVYGGTPGLYQPYGSRGGVPFAIVSPVQLGQPGDGPQDVWAGPPHGLHSLTYPDRGDTLARYTATPQMRPVRFDRPSNSPQAGQAYSQTVLMQGQQPGAPSPSKTQYVSGFTGRGWLGTGG